MKKVENVLWQAVDWVLYLSMIIMVIVTFANVIGRYVFNHSIAAADEIARMAFVWLTYIGLHRCDEGRNPYPRGYRGFSGSAGSPEGV